MSKVLAAIDNSSASQAVLAMAAAVADALDASMEPIHIVEDDGTALLPDEVPGAPVRALVGDPVELLLMAATEDDVVAVVLGAGDSPASSHRAGHLAMILAGRTDKPVLVVPSGFHPPRQLRTAVVAMEGSPGKARVLQRSIALSARSGLEIVVVHVDGIDSVPSFSDQVQYETEVYARELFARHLISAPQMRLELRIGVPAAEVLSTVKSARADLVVVGWPQTDDPERGMVAREIVDTSPVPVLLVAIA